MAFKILSIDGGGIRGIVPGQILVTLESKLQQRTNNPNARIGDYFDMVAGTSTGAILAAAYVCPDENNQPKFSAREAVGLYLQEGDEIFDVSFWRQLATVGGMNDEKYSADELERVLHTAFGDLKLSELLKPTCFVAYDVTNRSPMLFTQHDAVAKERDFHARDLLRASTAAPTYFEAAKISSPDSSEYVLVDGGIVANDPTLCAYSEAIKFDGITGIKDMMIFSLGTGKNLRSYLYPEIKNWGPLGWARPAIDLSLEGSPQMTEYHMKQMASTVTDAKLFRIQPELYGADTALDNASYENVLKLKKAGMKNAEQYDGVLEQVVDELLA